jgi:hypothetical protein
MKPKLLFPIIIYLGCAFIGSAFGDFISSELCIISWGDGDNEIQITEPYREYSDGPRQDTIGYMHTGDGPGIFFIDKNDNIYIQSSLQYFKGFHLDGIMFVDYSFSHAQYDYNSYFKGGAINFYVDSLCRIFVDGGFQNYIAVVDTLYNLVAKISPDMADSSGFISISNRGSDDVLSISSDKIGCLTYKDNKFLDGGSFMGWLASDDYYYDIGETKDSVLYAMRFVNPGVRCYPKSLDSLFAFDMQEIIGCRLIGVDNDTLLYILYRPHADSLNDYIRVYDRKGKITEQFMLIPQETNHYLYYINEPFFRPDGSVYQFLCKDDGLHVIKWSKK